MSKLAFNRPPRVRTSLPGDSYRIPAPPPPTHDPPKLNALVIGLSLAGSLMSSSVILIYFLSSSGQSGSTSHPGSIVYLIMASILVVSALGTVTSIVQHRTQKAEFLKNKATQECKFDAALAECRSSIAKAAAMQTRLMSDSDPELATLARRALDLDRRLWERRPNDDDFLRVRLGIGNGSPAFAVVQPTIEYSADGPLARAVRALAEQYRCLKDVPATIDLKAFGSLGIVGPQESRLSLARTIIAQICIQHAPEEVSVRAVCHSGRVAAWDWLKWLPHVGALEQACERRTLAFDPASAAKVVDCVVEEFRRRVAQRDESRQQDTQAIILLLDDPGLLSSHPGLGAVIADGVRVHVFVLMLAESVMHLPGTCGAIAEIAGNGLLSFQRAGVAEGTVTCKPDAAAVSLCEEIARALAPVEFRARQSATELPSEVRLLDLIREQGSGQVQIEEWWSGKLLLCVKDRLQIPLGMSQDGRAALFAPLEHGPHGLVAGTTGSGKSELLRSMVSALALTHHPHEIAFVLIDFKGGSAFADLCDLPHTVGMVTNLNKSMVQRAINAIRCELERRMRLFQAAGVQDIRSYQRLKLDTPLPALLVVIDEYAELHDQYGDLLDEFIRIARVGRTLGVWLVLATQRPAGKVKDDMSANMGYRMCLRVQTAEDSRDVLRGRPDAASLPVVPRGRMYYQVGDNEIYQLMQVAHVAGSTHETGVAQEESFAIMEVLPDGLRRQLITGNEQPLVHRPADALRARRDVEVVVDLIQQTATRLGIVRGPSLWPDVLPSEIHLSDMFARESMASWMERAGSPSRSWLTCPIGLVDEIELQRHSTLLFDLKANGGHFLATGAPQSGIAQFLHVVIYGMSFVHNPRELWTYILDFGGGDLKPLECLPGVGAYLRRMDEERVHRLCTMLGDELDRRRDLLLSNNVDSLGALRERHPSDTPAVILVALNNIFSFRQSYEDHLNLLLRIVREGGALGVHLLVTANRPMDVPNNLFTLLGNRLSFRLTDQQDYDYVLNHKPAETDETVPIGRGWWAQPFHEFQVARVAPNGESGDLEGLRELCAEMGASWAGERPPAVRVLPSCVGLADIWHYVCESAMVSTAGATSSAEDVAKLTACVGIESAHLLPYAVELGLDHPHFFIAGPTSSGKTTALKSLLIALANQYNPSGLQYLLVDMRKNQLQDLARLPHACGCMSGFDAVQEISRVLHSQLDKRRTAGQRIASHLIIAFDDAGVLLRRLEVAPSPALTDLVTLLNGIAVEGGDLGIHLVCTGAPEEMNSCRYDFVKLPRLDKSGLLLQTHDRYDLPMFGVRLPDGSIRPELPPGRAYAYRDGRMLLLQIASPDVAPTEFNGPASSLEWVDAIRHRWMAQTGFGNTES